MKVRTALLAMFLLDLAAGATWFAGRYGDGQPDALRLFLVWALPGLVFLCGLLTRERKARRLAAGELPTRLRLPGIPLPALPPVKPSIPMPTPMPAPSGTAASPRPAGLAVPTAPTAPAPRWTRLLLWIGLAIAIDLAPIGIAYQFGWLTLTYGDQQLAATRATTALWALPLLILLATRFYERTLRGRLFQGALESWGAPAAWTLSLLCGTALALPAIAPGLAVSAPPFVAAALVTALAREIGSTVLYRAAGLLAAGIFRGTLLFVDFFLIADWLAPVFPSANYVTSGDFFYLLRGASPLVAALLLVRFLPARPPAAPTLTAAAPAA